MPAYRRVVRKSWPTVRAVAAGRAAAKPERCILAAVDAPAAARWRKLVRARLAEMERLQPGRGAIGAAFWDGRAKRYASRMPPSAATADPFYRRLRGATGRRSTVLDVGAGPGRFTLALAPHVAAVTAVDPSGGMLDICRRQARKLGLDNVTCVQGRWEETDVAPAAVAFSSYVLPLIADAPGSSASWTRRRPSGPSCTWAPSRSTR